MSAKATMQTLPCGHRVVCRKCFIRTIQSAIADHSLPLKCIVCRANVLKLGSCKADKSLSSQSSLSSSATPSRSSRRPASSVATRIPQSKGTAAGGGAASRALTVGPGITSADHPMSRSYDVGRPPGPTVNALERKRKKKRKKEAEEEEEKKNKNKNQNQKKTVGPWGRPKSYERDIG